MSDIWQDIVDEIEEQDRERGWRLGDPYVHSLFLDAKRELDCEKFRDLLIKYPTYRPERKIALL
jgi:hypothetical protein